MGIILSILGVFSTLGSLIGAILKAIPPIVWLCIGCMFFGMWLTWGGCSFSVFPKRAERPEIYSVVSVPTGDSIIVKTGLLGRRRATIFLNDIIAPEINEKYAEQSRVSLEKAAGNKLTVKNGTLYGQFGTPLCMWQVMAGMADVSQSADKNLVKQRNVAKKNKLGIWSN